MDNTPREDKMLRELWQLTEEEMATTLTAIVCWIVWKRIVNRVALKPWDEEKEPIFNKHMMFIVTQVLLNTRRES